MRAGNGVKLSRVMVYIRDRDPKSGDEKVKGSSDFTYFSTIPRRCSRTRTRKIKQNTLQHSPLSLSPATNVWAIPVQFLFDRDLTSPFHYRAQTIDRTFPFIRSFLSSFPSNRSNRNENAFTVSATTHTTRTNLYIIMAKFWISSVNYSKRIIRTNWQKIESMCILNVHYKYHRFQRLE